MRPHNPPRPPSGQALSLFGKEWRRGKRGTGPWQRGRPGFLFPPPCLCLDSLHNSFTKSCALLSQPHYPRVRFGPLGGALTCLESLLQHAGQLCLQLPERMRFRLQVVYHFFKSCHYSPSLWLLNHADYPPLALWTLPLNSLFVLLDNFH